VVTFIDAIVSWKRKKKWSCLEEWNPTLHACRTEKEARIFAKLLEL